MSALRALAARLARALAEAIVPCACAACGGTLESALGPACGACRARLEAEAAPRRCAACSAPLAAPASTRPGETCGPCLAGRRLRVHAPRAHAGIARGLVHAFKYRGRRDVAPLLAGATCQAPDVAAVIRAADLVVPVPGDPVRRHERGFDTTALLAAEMAREVASAGAGSARMLRALSVRRARPQASRSAAGRRSAPAASMSPRWPFALLVRGRRVVIVDDVVTTGATLREAERVLLRLGARSVVAVACTRAAGELVPSRRRRRRLAP